MDSFRIRERGNGEYRVTRVSDTETLVALILKAFVYFFLGSFMLCFYMMKLYFFLLRGAMNLIYYFTHKRSGKSVPKWERFMEIIGDKKYKINQLDKFF